MRITAIVFALLATATAFAQTRPAWEWTDEERLALRFDAQSIHERAKAYEKERGPRIRANSVDASATPNIIEGNRNPELLLPWELFQGLILRAYSKNPQAREHIREEYATRAPWLAGAPQFWSELETAAKPFMEALARAEERSRAFGATGDRSLLVDEQRLNADVCSSRVAALDEARQAFGRARFDEFLYTAVAPGPVTIATGDDAPNASRLRWIAQGCR